MGIERCVDGLYPRAMMLVKDMTPELVQDLKRRIHEQLMRDLMKEAERFKQKYGFPPTELRFVPIDFKEK